MGNVLFNDDHLDMLRELVNIAVGNATANIADLLSAFGTMHIPHVAISDMQGLKAILAETIPLEQKQYVTKQLFNGKFGGEIIFSMSEESALNLGHHLYDVAVPNEADTMDAVIELTNILGSTIISRLTEELNTKVQFFAPSTRLMTGNQVLADNDMLVYEHIIIIRTVMEFGDQQISGQMFILTKDDMIENLRDLIDQKLEELFA